MQGKRKKEPKKEKGARSPPFANSRDAMQTPQCATRGCLQAQQSPRGKNVLTCSIIGNLGSDAELRYSTTGQPLLTVNVAANQRQKVDGQWQDTTEWCRVTVFGQRAETLHPHLLKGTKVYASGRLQARPWTDRNGNLKAGLELVANDIEFMGGRQDGQRTDDADGLEF